MKTLLLGFCITLFSIFQTTPSQAQSIKILGGNALNGAINGAFLGGAAMALNNSSDFAPVRIGVGAGTIFGIGVGIYDLSQVSKGQQFYLSGTFNDGNNSTIIVLLDTFYGAAAGVIVATAFNLIANQRIVEGLQYGSGAGAFAGFGFGLVDAFVLAEKPGDFAPPESAGNTTAGGLISISGSEEKYSVNILNPAIYSKATISQSSVSVQPVPGMDLLNVKVRL